MSALRAFFLLSDQLTFFLKAFFFFSPHLLCYWLTGEPRFSLNVSQETAWCLTWLIPHNSQRSSFNERWGCVWAGTCTQSSNSLAKALGWFWVPGDGSALLQAACTRLSGGWLRWHLRICVDLHLLEQTYTCPAALWVPPDKILVMKVQQK